MYSWMEVINEMKSPAIFFKRELLNQKMIDGRLALRFLAAYLLTSHLVSVTNCSNTTEQLLRDHVFRYVENNPATL